MCVCVCEMILGFVSEGALMDPERLTPQLEVTRSDGSRLAEPQVPDLRSNVIYCRLVEMPRRSSVGSLKESFGKYELHFVCRFTPVFCTQPGSPVARFGSAPGDHPRSADKSFPCDLFTFCHVTRLSLHFYLLFLWDFRLGVQNKRSESEMERNSRLGFC